MFILLCTQALHVYIGKSLPLLRNVLNSLYLKWKAPLYSDGNDENIHSSTDCDKWYNIKIMTKSAQWYATIYRTVCLRLMALHMHVSFLIFLIRWGLRSRVPQGNIGKHICLIIVYHCKISLNLLQTKIQKPLTCFSPHQIDCTIRIICSVEDIYRKRRLSFHMFHENRFVLLL